MADPEVNSMNFPVSKFVKMEKPSEESFGERSRKLQSTLSLEIKRRLLSVQWDDPDVRLELPIDEDIFYKVFGSLGRLSKSRGRTVHRITENSQLDSILGTRWSVRIKNEMGDFEAVRNGSVEYYLYERPPISDFAPAGGNYSLASWSKNHG